MQKKDYQRKLLIVPILHTKEDMGSLASRLSTEDGYISMASYFWKEVKEKVKKELNGGFKKVNPAPIAWCGVKVYQDGLPDTDKNLVEKIIDKVKSPNYQLLDFLKAKGAKIFGTEDPELLKEEYNFVSQILKAKDEENRNKMRQIYKNRAPFLLTERDSYIAKRIDRTLDKGDLGILFLGAAHQIKDKLSEDIQVEIL